jgi:DICT domain-containing protein
LLLTEEAHQQPEASVQQVSPEVQQKDGEQDRKASDVVEASALFTKGLRQ